ncbi:S-adenosyl-L-methionine-dependent methyltransferase [Fomes fomentarius]|nr:S-adenosyl-L-methionine-dependent methyltransferase [Fomes fomentarius]
MKIVAACGQLSAAVNEPWAGIMEDVMGGHLAACIRFLETANIVDILREAGPDGLHVNDILKAVLELRPKAQGRSPLTPSDLSRTLRLLATSHYLREVKPNVFANNRLSSWLDSGKPLAELRGASENRYIQTSGMAAYVGLAYSISYLTDWALPEMSLAPASDTNTPVLTEWVAPFNVAFNTRLDFFEWIELPGNEGRLVRFKHAMRGSRHYETKNGILQGFSWEDLPQGSVLVDVGGGIGATSILVAEAHPHLRVVVEDRAQVVSNAISAWGSQYSHLFESGRMSYRSRDFFEAWYPGLTHPGHGTVDVPSVFLVRLILHDWPDNEARIILSQLRAAAGAHTKLLIGDMLLPYACAEDPNVVPSDSPLLSNLGKAHVFGYLTDIVMMGLFNGKERTVDGMKELVLSAGWKVTETRRNPGSLWAYTTAVPV